jgi:hypothetical protein
MGALMLPLKRPVMGSHHLLNDLIAWLPINEKAGSGINNFINAVNDAAMTGGTWAGEGVVLDGTDDEIVMNRLAQIENDWTVALTVRPGDVTSQSPWVDQGDILVKRSEDDVIYGATDTTYTDYTGTLAAALATGTPIDIAVKRQGTTISIYANGTPSGSFTASGTALTSLTNMVIGATSRAGSLVFADMDPTNLAAAGEKAIVINASDDLQAYSGSRSLADVSIGENWNSSQMTIIIWCKLNFVPGDGVNHYVFDNVGTDITTNRIRCYITIAGTVWFRVYDKDSTDHIVSGLATGWAAGDWHQIVCRLDFKNDEIELYLDGASADAIPNNALSSDSIDAIESVIHLGSDSPAINQLNGQMTMLVENRSWSDAEITANYDSGAGTPFVVGPHTIYLLDASNDSTGGIYNPGNGGKFVTASSNSGTETTLTTAGGALTAFEDGGEYSYHDGTGYGVTLYGDGAPPDDTTFVGDDGGGALVSGAELVGVHADWDSQYSASAADNTKLDIALEDHCISFWIFARSDQAGSFAVPIGKRDGQTFYEFFINSADDTIRYLMKDGTDSFEIVGPNIRDDRWHHIAVIVDRDNAGASDVYLDGIAQSGTQNGTIGDVGSLSNVGVFTLGEVISLPLDGKMADIKILINGLWSAAQILYQATHPHDVGASAGTITEYYDIDENTGTTITAGVTSPGNDLTLSNAAAWDVEAYLSANLLADGNMENGGIGAWTIVATPTTVDKETDTDSDSQSLHIVAAADNDGVSQVIPASNGDKFYLHQRHKVTSGSFEVNVTNGGGGIETGIADASWTALEKIISATGNLTFQWLGEAAGDDFNVSRAMILPCVAGDSLNATDYYTRVFNVDTSNVGAEWSGLGSAATEVKAGDLYVRNWTRDAETADRNRSFSNDTFEDVAVWKRGLSDGEIQQWGQYRRGL